MSGKATLLGKQLGTVKPLGDSDLSLCYLAAPLLAGGQLLGKIVLESFKREDAFDEAAERLLVTVAGSLATALQGAQRFDETQRLLKETEARNAELAVINSIQQGVAGSLDFQGIVELVGERLREVLHSDNISIRWFDPATGLLHVPYAIELGQRFDLPPRQAGESSTWLRVLATRRPLLLTGTEVHAAPGTATALAECIVPIVAGDQMQGLVVMEDHTRVDAFGEPQIRMLSTVATAMGIALQSALRFDETQRLLRETEARNAELRVINSIQQGIAGSLDFNGIVELVGDALCSTLGSRDLTIRWLDPETGQLHFLYAIEHGQRRNLAPYRPRAGGTWDTLIAQRKPVVFNTRAEVEQGGVIPGTDAAQSDVIVPIVVGERVLGLLNVEDFEREYAYGEAEVRMLQTIVTSMGVALENARLLAETQRLLKETEARNAELAVINSIQQGIAGSLDFQAIVELVGDKLRDVLAVQDIVIAWRDEPAGVRRLPYVLEHGRRLQQDPVPDHLQRPIDRAMLLRKPVLVRNPEHAAELGVMHFKGTDRSLSSVFAPMFSGERLLGVVIVENHEREDGFDESQIRLLATVAASMGTALENARLFSETQRLLKETERRSSELAVINSIQSGMARSLDFAAIVDLVGDQLRALFRTGNLAIRWHDEAAGVMRPLYVFEHGVRLNHEPRRFDRERPLPRRLLRGETVVVNSLEQAHALGVHFIPGTDVSLAAAFVPVRVGERLIAYLVGSFEELVYI